jgi:hypothetical protein
MQRWGHHFVILCYTIQSWVKRHHWLASQRLANLIGPSLEEFQPLPYVKQLLLGGHRAAGDIQSKKCEQESKEDSRYGHIWDVF